MFSQNILWLPPLKHFIIKLFQFYLLRHSIRRIKIWLGERLPFGFLLLIFSEREKRFSYISPQVSFLFRNIFRLYPYHCHSKKNVYLREIRKNVRMPCLFQPHTLLPSVLTSCEMSFAFVEAFRACRVYSLVSTVNACAVKV